MTLPKSWIAAALFLGSAPLRAASPAPLPFPVPAGAPRETGAYRCLDAKTGAERWRSEWTTERGEEAGLPVIRSREEARGVYGKRSSPMQWRVDSVWDADTTWVPRTTVTEFRDPEGRLVERIEKTYRFGEVPGAGTITVRTLGAPEEPPRSTVLPIPAGTVGPEGIGSAFRSLPFGPDLRRRFHLVTGEPKLYRMRLTLEKTETVTVPAGTFRCHKIRMLPEFGLLGFLARPFIPDTFFWHSVEPPHVWIRYEGLESAPGTPRVVLELVSFSPAEYLK